MFYSHVIFIPVFIKFSKIDIFVLCTNIRYLLSKMHFKQYNLNNELLNSNTSYN